MEAMNKLFLTSFTFSSLISYAYAGGGSSGGGGSFICKELSAETKEEVIVSAESQDLWEAARKFQIIDSRETEIELSYSVLSKLETSGARRFAKEVRAALDQVLKIRSIEDVKLVSLGDSKHWLEKASCVNGIPDFAPAAIYKGEELVYSKKIFSKMDNISQAALNVHEAVYKVLRDEYGDTDSERTRKIVGFLFSDKPLEEVVNFIPNESFNPSSSKTYQEKFKEAYEVFKKGSPIRVDEMQNLGNCYKLDKPGKLIPVEVEKVTLTNNLSRDLNRRGTLKGFFGHLGFKEYPGMPLLGSDVLRTSRSSVLVYGFPQEATYGEDLNPIIGLQSFFNNQEELYSLNYRKSDNGDMIVTKHTNKFFTKCLETKNIFLGLIEVCNKSTDGTEHPDYFKFIENIFYCKKK